VAADWTPNLRRAPIEVNRPSLGPCHLTTSRASALTSVTVSPKVIANCRATSGGIGQKSAGAGWNNSIVPSGGMASKRKLSAKMGRFDMASLSSNEQDGYLDLLADKAQHLDAKQ
jgi:hypothetical protein